MYKALFALLFVLEFFPSGHSNLIRIKEPSSLQLVHVLFRHGDRTPEKEVIYPNDPHGNATYYPIGFGQLTNSGKRKLYKLGKSLHKRYGHFLGTYTIDTIDARSSDYNRTKMSLQLVLASLFPPENELVWERRLKWQPIPFNYWPTQEDHILGDPYKNCPKYRQAYNNFFLSEKGSKLYENFTEISEYLMKHAGIKPKSKEMAEVYFTLTTEYENGLKLPDWTNSIYPKKLLELAVVEYEVCTATPELKKLASGFLFNKIVIDTMQKIKNKLPENRKMFLYSGHEINIAYLLKFLGVYYPHVPPYGAYLIVELHKVFETWGIKMFYQDYTTKKLRKIKIPKCGFFCPFDQFVSLHKNYVPKSVNECFN